MTAADQIAAVLESYAARGVFRGFSRGPSKGGRASFRIAWHRGRTFDLTWEARRSTLRFASVLPAVAPEMFTDLERFVAARQSDDIVEHRRIDPALARVECCATGTDAGLTMSVTGGDLDYAVRKLIALVHEIYLVFLHDGKYYDYLIETFDLDPDYVQFA